MINVLNTPPVVKFVDGKPHGEQAMGASLSLKQGQSVVLVSGQVNVKVSNTKFHSLTATTFVIVSFETSEEKLPDIRQVEPAFVGQSIESGGITLAQITDVQSGSKLLTLNLAPGVEVRQGIK